MKKTLLIIRMSALGDVAMTVPVIYSFARRHPDWQVKVLTQAFFSRIFLERPSNVSFIIADPKGRHKGLAGAFRLIRDVHREGVTAVADFHNVLRSWIVDLSFILTGRKVRIVKKNRKDRKMLTRLEGKHLVRQRSYILRYFDVLAALDLPTEPKFTSLFPGKTLTGPANRKPKIGIAPFARYATKTYPPEMMEEVVSILTSRGCEVYLFGSRGKEAGILEQWALRHPGAVSVAGTLNIDQELRVMSDLDLMVSMDSANMHLASLAGTRVISIWGSTTIHCGFLGWSQKEEDAICLNLPCQPCSIAGKPECPPGHMNCLRQLQPTHLCDRIIAALPQ